MIRKVLWGPEKGKCLSCGGSSIAIRDYTSGQSIFSFCKPCWKDFLIECNVGADKAWAKDVMSNWEDDVVFVLIPDGEEDGTSQETGTWC